MVGGNISANISEYGLVVTIPRAYEIVLVVFLFVSAILAIFGNGIILLVEIRNRCKTSSDWLILFMAANDISCALINIPFYIVYHLGYWRVIGSDVTCKLHYYVEQTTMFSSVLLLCIIAIDRYLKTCWPHKKFLSPSRALRICVIETVTACLMMSPALLVMNYNGSGFCSHRSIAGGILDTFVPIAFILLFLLMFVIVCVCYIRVAFTMRNKLSLKSGVKDKKSDTGNGISTSERMTSRNMWTLLKVLCNKRSRKISPVINDAGPSNFSAKLNTVRKDESVAESSGSRIDKVTCSDTNSDVYNLKSLNQTSLQVVNERITDNIKPGVYSVGWTEVRIYRTTKIMFAVTMVFVLSWIPTLAMFFIRRLMDYQWTVGGQVFALFARKAFFINTFMNPFFYIWMSSTFKDRTRKTISELFRCRGAKTL